MEDNHNSQSPRNALSITERDGITEIRTTFVPKAKHPQFWVPAEIRTEAAFKILLSTFEPAQKALYHLACTIPALCRSHPTVINGVINKLTADVDALDQELDNEIARLAHKARNDGVSPPEGYCNESSLSVLCYTPTSARYVNLLCKMDKAMQLVDALWFSTGIPEKERNNKIMEWRNRMMRFHRTLNTHHLHALGLATRVARSEDASAQEIAEMSKDITLPTLEKKKRVVKKADTPKKMIARAAKPTQVKVIAGKDIEEAAAERNRKKMETMVAESAPVAEPLAVAMA